MAENHTTQNEQALTTRKIQSARTRQLIFDTAIKLFAEKGFYNVKIQDITKAAGTSKGSFYTHFAAKQDIIVEEYQALDNEYEKLRDSLDQFDNCRDKLFYFVENVYRLCNEIFGFELTYVIYDTQLNYSKKDTFINDETRPLYNVLEQIILEGQESGELKNEMSPKELTIMIIRLMRGTLYDWCLYDGKFDTKEEGMQLMRIFYEGIRKQ